jgi:hypothetical protein
VESLTPPVQLFKRNPGPGLVYRKLGKPLRSKNQIILTVGRYVGTTKEYEYVGDPK